MPIFFRSVLITNISWLALLAALVSSANASDNPIVKQMDAFSAAFNAADAEGVAAIYAKKGTVFAPGANPAVGRDAVTRLYAAAFASGVKDLLYRIDDLEQTGPAAAVEIGMSQVTIGNQKIQNRYLHVWKLEDGQWLIHRDIYNVLATNQ